MRAKLWFWEGLRSMTDSRFVKCTQCGALNEPRAVFCSRCGASLPRVGSAVPRPRFHAASLAMGSALVVGLAILAFVLYASAAHSLDKSADVMSYVGQKGIPASTEPPVTDATSTEGAAQAVDGSQTEPVSTTTPEPPVMIRPKATVSSSALAGTPTASFQATNLLDGDLSTVWTEGADGLGVGEWIRFDLTKPTVLGRIEIANGYQKDETRFAENPRVRLVSVQYSSGANQLVELYDTAQIQYIVPADEAVEWFKLVIVSVYSGGQDETTVSDDVSTSENTSLSEVHLFEKTD